MRKGVERVLFYPSVGIILFACLLLAECSSYYKVSFDEKGWQGSGVRGRGRMADDLVGRRALVGKTKAETLTILGKPDRESDTLLEYQVAHIERCSWIWKCYVQVSFDHAGKVADTWISD